MSQGVEAGAVAERVPNPQSELVQQLNDLAWELDQARPMLRQSDSDKCRRAAILIAEWAALRQRVEAAEGVLDQVAGVLDAYTQGRHKQPDLFPLTMAALRSHALQVAMRPVAGSVS